LDDKPKPGAAPLTPGNKPGEKPTQLPADKPIVSGPADPGGPGGPVGPIVPNASSGLVTGKEGSGPANRPEIDNSLPPLVERPELPGAPRPDNELPKPVEPETPEVEYPEVPVDETPEETRQRAVKELKLEGKEVNKVADYNPPA
jgi:hypothetical protein